MQCCLWSRKVGSAGARRLLLLIASDPDALDGRPWAGHTATSQVGQYGVLRFRGE